MENEHHPQMAEIAEAAYRLRLVVGRQQQQFAATVFDQPRLAGTANFSLYGERITPICSKTNSVIWTRR